MKEYRNNEQLIEYLLSKGITINDVDKAKLNLERYSYYSIINGYKSVFKNKDNTYKENVTFEEIFALYEFDKNIKSIFLKYILEIEVIVKSLMANLLTKKYGIKDYLNKNNFNQNSEISLVNNLIISVNEEIENNYKKHAAITHYKDKYGFIPPFVLTKVLTLGLISRYYGLLKQEDRQAISKYFKLPDNILKQILINLTMVRNISAHSDRLFCYRSKFYISFKNIEKNYKKTKNFTNLYMIIKCMELLLDNEKYQEFRKALNKEIKQLNNKLQSIKINDILRIMGYEV